MSARRWLALILAVALLGGAVMLCLPELVRRVALAQIHALTERPVTIEAVEVNLLTGQFAIRGLHLTERDGTPFVDFERLDVHVHLPSLVLGHLRIREIVLSDSTVRVVRLANEEFNISDFVRGSGTARKALDVTVDRFAVAR